MGIAENWIFHLLSYAPGSGRNLCNETETATNATAEEGWTAWTYCLGIFFTLMKTLLLAISCRILQLPHYYIRDLELKSKAKKTEDDNLAKLTQKIDAISAKVDLIEARLNESAIREELAELRGQVAAIFALRVGIKSRMIINGCVYLNFFPLFVVCMNFCHEVIQCGICRRVPQSLVWKNMGTMTSMDGKVGGITHGMGEIDENLNYLLGRMSLVVQEFNMVTGGLGTGLQSLKDSLKEVGGEEALLPANIPGTDGNSNNGEDNKIAPQEESDNVGSGEAV